MDVLFHSSVKEVEESVALIENQAQITYHGKLLKITTLYTEEMETQRKKSWGKSSQRATFPYYLHSDSIDLIALVKTIDCFLLSNSSFFTAFHTKIVAKNRDLP